ncbi:hypothetical protein Sfulv_56240 [Streptomyces fulvorobeus]|uniref:Uncharacterized protein n=1 Tax=Streptomyces fulvorobeus TaxID=284028 RepID=A0A7J0CFX7_9ACTN|nr:hypothetical protein Sfulv_56240 [Streptomyces fulvorobeus]
MAEFIAGAINITRTVTVFPTPRLTPCPTAPCPSPASGPHGMRRGVPESAGLPIAPWRCPVADGMVTITMTRVGRKPVRIRHGRATVNSYPYLCEKSDPAPSS